MKAKEDEHQLKLLKEQYLDFDGDDDGRRIKLLNGKISSHETKEVLKTKVYFSTK